MEQGTLSGGIGGVSCFCFCLCWLFGFVFMVWFMNGFISSCSILCVICQPRLFFLAFLLVYLALDGVFTNLKQPLSCQYVDSLGLFVPGYP
jgi:hypothetical protein